MKTGEKRDVIVREIIKPLLKERGFRSKKTDWWKELSDGYLFIHMKNSLFNSAATGYCFCFQFSAAPNAQISGALEKQWIMNQPCCLAESAFLPYCGYLSPNRTPLGYQIDGYRDYAPTDVAVEEIASQVKNDFTEYILPEIEKVHSVSDFQHDKPNEYYFLFPFFFLSPVNRKLMSSKLYIIVSSMLSSNKTEIQFPLFI